jgi:hypothetical protein
MMIRTYSELIRLSTFEERFQYCKLSGRIGTETFGFDRYINQAFYTSKQWKEIRNYIIVRDNSSDLGVLDRGIYGFVREHHLNPTTVYDFESGSDVVLDPEFLISVSLDTHNAIHFGNEKYIVTLPIERRRGDTKLW